MTQDKLKPDVRAFLDEIAAKAVPGPLTVQVARDAVEQLAALSGPKDTISSIEERMISDHLRLRIYRPNSDPDLPILLFIHGGGWIRCSLQSHDTIARSLCARTPCIVASVDYRLAPEHPYPAGLNDSYEALVWVAAHAEELGGSADRIAICGDSSGGNIAAAVTLMARDRGGPALLFQLLVYPVTNYEFETPSFIEFAEGYQLTTEQMRWYWSLYVANEEQASYPYISVLRADLSDLPPAHIISAECDPLRDQAEAYGHRLRQYGVPTTIQRYDGMIHGFWSTPGLYASSWQGVCDSTDVLRAAFSGSTDTNQDT